MPYSLTVITFDELLKRLKLLFCRENQSIRPEVSSLLPQVGIEDDEGYAKPSLKKCRPIAARNEDKKVFSGRL